MDSLENTKSFLEKRRTFRKHFIVGKAKSKTLDKSSNIYISYVFYVLEAALLLEFNPPNSQSLLLMIDHHKQISHESFFVGYHLCLPLADYVCRKQFYSSQSPKPILTCFLHQVTLPPILLKPFMSVPSNSSCLPCILSELCPPVFSPLCCCMIMCSSSPSLHSKNYALSSLSFPSLSFK